MTRDPMHVSHYLVTQNPTTGLTHAEPQLALPVDIEDRGEVRVYRVTLPFLPPSKNQYDGLPGQYQNGVKGKWMRHVVKKCEEIGLPKGITHMGLSAALVFPSNRRRDPQNYAATMWNFVPDALQKGGFLLDDRDGRIDWGSNLGIKFHVDDRRAVPEVHRKKTHLSIAVRVGDGHE